MTTAPAFIQIFYELYLHVINMSKVTGAEMPLIHLIKGVKSPDSIASLGTVLYTPVTPSYTFLHAREVSYRIW